MKWIDYRNKLGIGFSDNRKAKLLRNKIANLIENDTINEYYTTNDYYQFCLMVGIRYKEPFLDSTKMLAELFHNNEMSIPVAVSYYIAFVNTKVSAEKENRKELIDTLEDFLEDLDIAYELLEDKDGWFVFPKGVKEFDDSLVSQPLEWLRDYPNAEKLWTKALRNYAEVNEQNASDVADGFRKAIEAFFQDFFGGTKSLENYKSDYGTYLKNMSVPSEISGNFETLLQAYTNYINNYAKHRDATSDKVVEYLMYQTGNIMRLLITLKQKQE
ncbi:MAG: hypothetical protein IK101_04185 [Oscillospiraceae bacterium]|nr:hypothetical protein [Oscillospiraceae bacterium]